MRFALCSVKNCIRFILVSLCSFSTAIACAQNTDTVKISINAVAGLQFDKARFAVRPGAIVSFFFKNTDEMSHNLVLTKPGMRLAVVKEAEAIPPDLAEKQGFVPKSNNVLFSIPVLHPSETQRLVFKAPLNEGVYPYVCTFTGHGYVMYGAMYVTTGQLPAIQNDANVPPNRMNDGTHDDDDHNMVTPQNNGASANAIAPKFTATSHPYNVEPPTLYRIFMPDAGPAAIAVNLPGNISYCWDAGAARLRYAWYGGFVDNADHWKGNGRNLAKILGTIFYPNSNEAEFRIGNATANPAVVFKGYRLLNKYPQFLYKLNNADVTEVIASAQWEGKGLVRVFTFQNLKNNLYFVPHSGNGITYTSSAGTWKNGILKLTPKQARQFTITMVATPQTNPNHQH